MSEMSTINENGGYDHTIMNGLRSQMGLIPERRQPVQAHMRYQSKE